MKIKDFFTNETYKNMISYAGAGCIIVLFYLIMSHLPAIGDGLKVIFNAVAPFVCGFIFAFLMKPFRNLVENKWLKNQNWKFKTKRIIAVSLAMLLFILIIVAFFAVLLPQLASSITSFVQSFSTYLDHFESLLNPDNASSPEVGQVISAINSGMKSIVENISTWLTGASGGIQKILSAGVNFVVGIVNAFIGIIVAVYMLYDEEKFKKTFKRIFYALLPEKGADWLIYVYRLNKVAFNGFIFGKLIDSLIIGILCYISVAIMRIPYPVLIAVIIGLTNIIPVFGPFIGAIPCLFILVVIDPWAALKFLIFIIILQQFDGNLLGPKILGGTIGLPTLWTMFAIIVGGSLFGIVGMIVGVPIFSVLYTLIKDYVNYRLKKKELQME